MGGLCWWFIVSGVALDPHAGLGLTRAQFPVGANGSGSHSHTGSRSGSMKSSAMDMGTGLYVSFTGLVFLVPAFCYSSLTHASKLVKELGAQRETKDLVRVLASFWVALTAAPIAIHYQSVFLAYVTVFALYSALGFSVACCGLCYFVGFSDKHATVRVAVTSACSLTIYSCMRVLESYHFDLGGIDSEGNTYHTEWLAPFVSPLTVMGALTLYLALLILSSRWYESHTATLQYRNMLMIAALVAGLFAGNTFGMQGLANTATTFLVMFIVEKYVEVHVEKHWNVWVMVLLLSLAMYKAALYLHLHPDFVASIFAGF